MLYVNPDDFNASDLISNNGNSPTRPFKTIQRALLEVARFSYIQGQNNDKYDQFTINLSPGEYIIDNRPGKSNSAEVSELSDQSNFDILDPNNDLYKFNSTEGGLVIPRGTSLVGMDLRKTRVRPRYVPDPANSAYARTSIFKVTGACYFWQFSLFDALPTSDVSGQGGVYNAPGSTTIVNANYSHHKVTCFTYSDQTDLDLFYAKAARAFASIPTTPGELEARTQETRIVGPLQQAGQKGISTINVSGSLVTVVTTGPHEVFEGQQITIEKITGAYSSLNGTYYVTSVNNDSELVITVNGITPGSVPSSDLTNAIVKAEIDTVDSSSPYIFNCSLRSTYGLCGLWADGSRVSGFKSMVVAQFTGVSLQKDDRAFVKFTETTTPNPSFVLEGGASDSISLHQDSSGGVYYRGDATTGWRHYHIRVSNNAFIQSVSVFAVGYAEQHLIENGGDYSITNSNSNFGTQALVADGFRPDAFTLDKKGDFTHVIPPQALGIAETEVPYYPLDVQKSRANVPANGRGTKLFLFEQTDPNNTPVFDINQNKLGGKIDDKVFVNLTDPATSRINEYEAPIDPSGIETHLVTNVNVANDTFTTQSTNEFETATPIRLYSDTGYLPLGMESNKLYYAIKITNTSFKIAPSEEDARAGAGGAANSIVNIRSTIPANATLTVKAYVSDTDPELPRFNVSVNANLETFSTGTFPHGFTTGDKVFFNRRILADGNPSTGALPQITQQSALQNLSLTTEYFVYVPVDANGVKDAYTFKIADSESNANNNIPIPIETNGDADVLTVYRNIQKSPLRYDPAQSNWFISVKSGIENTIHPILTSSNTANIYNNPSLSNTENVFMRRLSDNRQLADRTYRLRYVIDKTILNARPPLVGYVVARKTDDSNVILPYNTQNQSNQTDPFERVYFVYKVDTILPHIPGEQNGVYYLTILIGDIGPKGSQFNSPTDTFGFLKYSQDVGKIYPDLDKDNPEGNPDAAVTVADNLVHGLVYQDDDRSSITREAVNEFLRDAGFSNLVGSLVAQSGKATSGQENRLVPFDSNLATIGVELRRTSQVRAGNQTFEYTGFGSGNYSTGFPSKQEVVLTDREVLYSQAQRRRAGVVFYSGLNAYGDLYVGNQKINAITGETEILDKPILKVAGSAAVVNDEYVPYVSGTKNVNIEGTLVTGGGANKTANAFNNETLLNEGAQISTKDPTTVNRALVSHDLNLRPKGLALQASPSNGTIKQMAYMNTNLVPVTGIEGTFLGDHYYKNKINVDTRHEGYIYVGDDLKNGQGNLLNAGWRHVGLVGTGHLTSIEESVTLTGSVTSEQPYEVVGKFGINQDTPTESFHVGTGNGLFDNNLTVTGDLAVNGGDFTSTAPVFNYTNQSPTVNFSTNATTMTVGASNAPLGAGTIGGTSTVTLNSDKTILKGDVEFSGKFDSGTSGSKTFNATVTADVANFMTTPSTVNFNTQTTNAFTGATNLNFGADTGITRINNNLHVDGNLVVDGTTTTVNSTTTRIVDPIITLGGGEDGAALTANDTKDRGLELKYYDDGSHYWSTGVGEKSAYMIYDVSGMNFRFFMDAPNNNDVINETNSFDAPYGRLARCRMGSIRITPNDWNRDTGSNAILYDGSPFEHWDNTNDQYNHDSIGELNSGARQLFSKYGVEPGVICMWSGTGSQIPHGWAICDGTTHTDRYGNSQATPDLRERFVIGSGGSHPRGSTGGAFTYTKNTGNNSINPTLDNSLGVDVQSHSLAVGEIPQHRHGISHSHEGVQAEMPDHQHGYSDKYLTDSQGAEEHGENDNDGRFVTDSRQTQGSGPIAFSFNIPSTTMRPDAISGEGVNHGLKNPADAHSHGASLSGSISLQNVVHTHTLTNYSVTPPYYALIFIMKL